MDRDVEMKQPSQCRRTLPFFSTPGPADVEEPEDVVIPEPQAESTAMEVDEAPPVKRPRPISHPGTEIPDESPSLTENRDEQVQGTPVQLGDYEEGEAEEATTDAAEASTEAKSTEEEDCAADAGVDWNELGPD